MSNPDSQFQQSDIRSTPAFIAAKALYRNVRRAADDGLIDAVDQSVSPDGRWIAYAGLFAPEPAVQPVSQICVTERATGQTIMATSGTEEARAPKFAPDGSALAYLVDRKGCGWQIHILTLANGVVTFHALASGWVEDFHWSPDGRTLLAICAAHGADTASSQGGTPSAAADEQTPSWLPRVSSRHISLGRRTLWTVRQATGDRQQISCASAWNIWEAAWSGSDVIVAVASHEPVEGAWYKAVLICIDLNKESVSELYRPRFQVGLLAGAPDGRRLAFVEAVCSDRGIVAGDLRIVDREDADQITSADLSFDVSSIAWLSADRLLLAGHQRQAVLVGTYDRLAERFDEQWRSTEVACSSRFATASAIGAEGDCAIINESFAQGPELAQIVGRAYQVIRTFRSASTASSPVDFSVQSVDWSAADGLALDGYLLTPPTPAPHRLIMAIHGGPVFQWQPKWLGRLHFYLLALLDRGYAIFLPNPRGSAGRGMRFAAQVLGDLGGAETFDLLSGIDDLTRKGLVDPSAIGVMGQSHGGFMTSWLIGKDNRFTAAVSIAPVINHQTHRLLSNIPEFTKLFLPREMEGGTSGLTARSPLTFADNVQTPVLNICGEFDRCTPPLEAEQFHKALTSRGMESVLLIYPGEGHGIRRLPAVIDQAARIVEWFDAHMPPV